MLRAKPLLHIRSIRLSRLQSPRFVPVTPTLTTISTRHLTSSRTLKMPSDKADPTTETLPAEQANPVAPAPVLNGESSAKPASSSAEAPADGDAPGEMSKKGGKYYPT